MSNLLRTGVLAWTTIITLLIAGCDDRKTTQTAPRAAPTRQASAAPQMELLFLYGSEKKDWINDVTAEFNASGVTTGDGRRVRVNAVPMGSGECVDEVLAGRRKAHLVSPASAAFVTWGNAKQRALTNEDLFEPTEDLVLSPVVIAMWKPMAEALGWPKKPIGWAQVLELSTNPRGWGAYGHPEWGALRFGHTHPEYSNSGLISVLAEVYAASGKARGLTVEDLAKPEVARFVSGVEKAVVHYGSSTGFFADKMFDNGTAYLSAAVVYESSVIDSYKRSTPTEFPVVAIYPKEGSFWSDHPVGVVRREWVGAAERDAAQKYVRFLRGRPQQEKALRYGFRPADTSVPLGEPITPAYGVDSNGIVSALEVPGAAVIDGAIELWRKNKKHANVVLVFDTSGSMAQQDRIRQARLGAGELIDMLGDEDVLSLLPFSTNLRWSGVALKMRDRRAAAKQTVSGLMPDGDTALYDAITTARQYLTGNPTRDRISAVVVLTDGEDNASKTPLNTLLARIKSDGERAGGVRVFTIGYGAGANKDVLKRIADQTRAKFYEGTPDNIRAVFKDIATFF
jgi:Ca-activated chloride channel family protein